MAKKHIHSWVPVDPKKFPAATWTHRCTKCPAYTTFKYAVRSDPRQPSVGSGPREVGLGVLPASWVGTNGLRKEVTWPPR